MSEPSASPKRIQELLLSHEPEAKNVVSRKLAGGACQQNWKVTWESADRSHVAALRVDSPTSLPGSIDRKQEKSVIDAARRAGVLTPAARWLSADVCTPGDHGYFLDWVPGVADGRSILRSMDPAAPEGSLQRKALVGQLASELAKVHSIPKGDVSPGLTGGYNSNPNVAPTEAALASLRTNLDQLSSPRPGLEYAVAWLRDHQITMPSVVVHGDYRLGNFMVAEGGLVAILDWEFAHFSSRAEDLAWFCLRDWRFGATHLGAGGLTQRHVLLDAYAAASGCSVDKTELLWWEVYGNLSWALGASLQADRYRNTPAKDIELLAIGRRTHEMEWEALRLVGKAQH